MSAVLRVATARLAPVKAVLCWMSGAAAASRRAAAAARRPRAKEAAGRLARGGS
jgi:hypothetical protein